MSYEHAIFPGVEIPLIEARSSCETWSGKSLQRVKVKSVEEDIDKAEKDKEVENLEIGQLLQGVVQHDRGHVSDAVALSYREDLGKKEGIDVRGLIIEFLWVS